MIQYLNVKFLLIFLFPIIASHLFLIFVFTYGKIWWADIVLHFAGGFWVGLVVLWFLFNSNKFPLETDKLPFYILIIAILSFTALIGVLWEFMEFILDQITGYKSYSVAIAQENLKDTMSDLFFDLFGALLSGAFLKFRNQNNM